MSRAIHFEYRRPGKDTITYEETLVLDRPDVKVLLGEYSGEDVREVDSVLLEHGAPMIWFVFSDAWHDVGRFHLADGTFTGWYTNFSHPVEMNGDHWIGRDLFLDLWQPAAGDPVWLDEEEYNAAVKSGLLDKATARRVMNERGLIELQLGQGEWPPPIARDLELGQVKALLAT